MLNRKTTKHAGALIAFAFAIGIALQAGITVGKKLFPAPPVEVIHSYAADEAPKG